MLKFGDQHAHAHQYYSVGADAEDRIRQTVIA